VTAIAVGAWQWSCTANCAGTTCTLGPGAADSNSCAIVAVRHCGGLQILAPQRATTTVTCRSTALWATTSTAKRWDLSSAGRCPTRSAAWRAGRISRDCAPARRPPLSTLQPLSHTFSTRPVLQGLRRIPRPYRQRAVDALRADCAHVHVRPHAQPGSRRCGACQAASAWLRVGGSSRAAACFTARDQGLVQERLHRPDPGEHHCAHQAGLAVRAAAAAARAVFWPTRAFNRGCCGAALSTRTASPAACRRRSLR
jgi:hypothetical protein